jgi:TPP-dependent pyruvate/acetoin dehydrogenase alpha subunit
MKRYPAFDPPEYVDWKPDASLMAEYRATVEQDSARRRCVAELRPDRLLALYAGMVRFRLHDIALKRWVRQGVISKAWLGTGEEATTVGAVHALNRAGSQGDVVGPMIRNAGACHEMGMSVADMLRGYLATADSPSAGRDLHIGGRRYGIVFPISMVGSLAPVMTGYALAFQKLKVPRVGLTWVGDGATKTGEVHEAFNFAAAQRLPIVFVIQNNQVALGTHLQQHHVAADFGEWGRLYGAEAAACDGNHVLDAYAATRWAVDRCRAGAGPVFLSATTFRMGGHATHDEADARKLFSPETFAHWGRRDPIGCYENWLLEAPLDLETGGPAEAGAARDANAAMLARVEADVTEEVESAAEEALASRSQMPRPEEAAHGVYGEWPNSDYDGRAPFES